MGERGNGANQKGFILIIVAAFLTTVVWAIAGLAVDVSRAYSVKRELAKAVDAAALTGAANLYPLPPAPAWAAATSAASTFVTNNNTVAGAQLSAADVQVISGYWSSTTQTLNQSIAPGVCNGTGTPCTVDGDCTGNNGCFYTSPPAIQVTASKPVPTFFAKILGWDQFQASATAVAVLAKSGPEVATMTGMPPGTIFPLAIGQQLVDTFTTTSPTDPNFTIGPSLNNAQWCDWGPGGGVSANTLTGYINNILDPNGGQAPQLLQAGGNITLAPSGMNATSVFTTTTNLINAGKGLVFLPVIANPGGNGVVVVRGFARAQLLSVINGDTITGRFIFQKLVR